MNKLPEYIKYNDEKDIALLDNSSVAFLEQLKHHGVDSASLLSSYDVILVPDWVLEEICDSSYREAYLNDMVELDLEDSAIWLPAMHQNWPLPGSNTASGRAKKKNAGEISLTILAEVFSWYYPLITSLTVMIQDSDAHTFITKAQEQLVSVFSEKHPITVTYKSNDFVFCELFRSGRIQLSDIRILRKDARKVTYIQQRPDKSTALITEKLDNAAFERLIQDKTANIIF